KEPSPALIPLVGPWFRIYLPCSSVDVPAHEKEKLVSLKDPGLYRLGSALWTFSIHSSNKSWSTVTIEVWSRVPPIITC
ncbi:hypothetical protein Tco_1495574, partial [Tanacetum coccineum]